LKQYYKVQQWDIYKLFLKMGFFKRIWQYNKLLNKKSDVKTAAFILKTNVQHQTSGTLHYALRVSLLTCESSFPRWRYTCFSGGDPGCRLKNKPFWTASWQTLDVVKRLDSTGILPPQQKCPRRSCRPRTARLPSRAQGSDGHRSGPWPLPRMRAGAGAAASRSREACPRPPMRKWPPGWRSWRGSRTCWTPRSSRSPPTSRRCSSDWSRWCTRRPGRRRGCWPSWRSSPSGAARMWWAAGPRTPASWRTRWGFRSCLYVWMYIYNFYKYIYIAF